MKILSLDLGTKTGWATNYRGSLELGTWTLATPKEVADWGKTRLTRRRDPRIPRLLEQVSAFCGLTDTIVFEEVAFSTFTLQTQLWSALRAAVWLSCCKEAPYFQCVPVGTLKKFATGSGSADKLMMMQAAVRTNPGRFALQGDKIRDLTTNELLDDNAADALHLLRWAEQNIHLTK